MPQRKTNHESTLISDFRIKSMMPWSIGSIWSTWSTTSTTSTTSTMSTLSTMSTNRKPSGVRRWGVFLGATGITVQQ
ncbi:MAG: hypothetical protein GY757_34530 [bacterium]|nr:hypothetical protein [bacterium]